MSTPSAPITTEAIAAPNANHAERDGKAVSGIAMLVVMVGLLVAFTGLVVVGIVNGDGEAPDVLPFVLGLVGFSLTWLIAPGFFILQPNKAAVLTLLGAYKGTVRDDGIHWVNPLFRKQKISLRVRNFDTTPSKVNDANGNPIHVAAVVVWRVVDTAKAVFQVDDLEHFVEIQSETAVRHLARSYPYDSFLDEDSDEPETTLIGDSDEVNDTLTAELAERMAVAGVLIIEARLTDLSYAQEIAEAMLRRQQASAIVAARRKIVEGAVLMVRDAVFQLEQGNSDEDAIPLDNDRKATFAANLMTVIASDQPTNPVVNVGTLTR